MQNHFVYWMAKSITTVSFIGVVISCIIAYPKMESMDVLIVISILSCVINSVLKIYWIKKDKKNEERFSLRWTWIDLFIVFLFFYRMKDLFTIEITLNSLENGWVINLSGFIIWISIVTMILSVINVITSEKYGWGITRVFRAFSLWSKYMVIYTLLQNECGKWIQNRYELSDMEYDLFCYAAQYRKSMVCHSFPVILRKDADFRSFLRKWLFNISLVNGKMIQFKSSRDGDMVKIDLEDSKLAIINNSGRRFLRWLYNGDKEHKQEMRTDNDKFYSFLDYNQRSYQYEHLSDNIFYRWGSAGALPIVKWRGKKWIAFVYRDIYPTGWNLPLGGSESELEKGRPGITAIRETFEEIIVSERAPKEYSGEKKIRCATRRELYHHYLNYIEGEVNYQANKRRFYREQNEIIQQTCDFRFETNKDSIECEDENTSLTITVNAGKYNNLRKENPIKGSIFVVNSYEQAIECIKPICFSINDENELRMGEVDYVEEKWINNPVILIDYERLNEYFKKEIVYINEDHKTFGESMFLDILTESQNYHIFGVNMDDRKKHLAKLKEYKQSLYLKDIFSRKKRKRIDAQINYLENFISSNDNHFTKNNKLTSGNEKENPGYYLCPVSWKALLYFFSNSHHLEKTQKLNEV